jgi:hypothetical protein
MYLPEDVLQNMFPATSSIELSFVRTLAPVQHDCPPQWLRDRLLRLADGVDSSFAPCVEGDRDNSRELQLLLERAGLILVQGDERSKYGFVPPADAGKRVGEDELGYWNEEMNFTTRCGASIEGGRQDGLQPSFPGIESML